MGVGLLPPNWLDGADYVGEQIVRSATDAVNFSVVRTVPAPNSSIVGPRWAAHCEEFKRHGCHARRAVAQGNSPALDMVPKAGPVISKIHGLNCRFPERPFLAPYPAMYFAIVLLGCLQTASGWTSEGNCQPSRSASMVQLQASSSSNSGKEQEIQVQSPAACAPLQNKGVYFTVSVCVGTPPQCFDTVADTGSDNVIITSCVCDDLLGTGCPPHAKCFTGTGRSSTFHVADDPVVEFITFGSGTVETAVATDIVDVAGVRANMSDALLLLVNRADLEISGDFQGILGLGLPKKAPVTSGTVMEQTSSELSGSTSAGPSWACILFPHLCEGEVNQSYHGMSQGSQGSRLQDEQLFLRAAHIKRFSLCFLDSGLPGALRLGVAPFGSPIPQIGQQHWGIGFVGMSVGPRHEDAPSQMIFCDQKTAGMKSPCGIIPDSGTTLITGPSEQIKTLETKICQEWPRCRERGHPSSALFQDLLLNCSGWLSEGDGLAEIPSIFFHVQAGGGEVKAFELTSWAFVTQSFDDFFPDMYYCFAGFGAMDYVTPENGPVWIFGTPLFYEYIVGFDQVSSEVSFEKAACEPCHVWTKGDAMGNSTGPFITYYENIETKTPARRRLIVSSVASIICFCCCVAASVGHPGWRFFSGMYFDILRWEPGKQAI
eukprot:Skav203730  [mRNA]  locus=scaffold4858:6631:13279:- [translate_table: standard]